MRLRRRCNGLLIALLCCLAPAPGQGLRAADWSCSPSLEVSEEYNSNLLLSSVYELEDFITRAIPRVQVEGETERNRFRFETSVPVEKYINHSGFDTVDNRSTVSLASQWLPTFATDLRAHFIKDTTFETELETAGLREDRADRMRYGFDLEGTYWWSERVSLAVSGALEKSNFPDGPYPDALRSRAGLNPAWVIRPGRTAGLYASYAHTDYDTSTTIQTVTGTVYWQEDWTERVRSTLGVGYFYTWTDRKAFGIESEDDGFVFDATLDYSWTERFSLLLSAGSNQYDTVDARSIVRTYVQVSPRYQFSPVLSSGLDFGYDFTTESGLLGRDTHYPRVSAFVRWEFIPHLFLRFYGGYGNLRTARDTGDTTADRFRAGVAVQAHWPRLLANH